MLSFIRFTAVLDGIILIDEPSQCSRHFWHVHKCVKIDVVLCVVQGWAGNQGSKCINQGIGIDTITASQKINLSCVASLLTLSRISDILNTKDTKTM